MHWFLKFILGMKLCMFRTVPLSIIRSFSLYTRQWEWDFKHKRQNLWQRRRNEGYAVCTWAPDYQTAARMAHRQSSEAVSHSAGTLKTSTLQNTATGLRHKNPVHTYIHTHSSLKLKYITFLQYLCLPNDLFSRIYKLKICGHLSLSAYMLHALPISFLLI
jgi:hypothetical protein